MARVSNKDKERIAYDLYLNTEKTQKEICEIVGWSEKTFSRHKSKGKWDELKSATELTPQKLIVSLYQRLAELSEEGKALDADKIIKIASSIEKLSDRKLSVSAVINTFKEFTTWLYEKDPELAKSLNGYQKEFVDLKVNGRI